MVACLKIGRCPLQSSLHSTSRPFLLKTLPHHTWVACTHRARAFSTSALKAFLRKGLTPPSIGVTLHDSHGIPQVRFVTGNKILRVLKSNGAPPSPRPPSLPLPRVSYADCLCFSSSPRSLRSRSCSPSFTDTFCLWGTVDPRGPLVPRQKGGRGAQAPRSQLQGQGLQVLPDPHREPDPPGLPRYCKTKQQIPPTFKYDSATASTLIA
ncbi:hypothetical protein FIBSPDRAFT_958548 [Athelia psychrophila]|uniref:Uncharacterized protein n=1 Tax=Athelia psychrophila TaxID=1759441 RepID=A0A166EF35_9AGAM|nr:hypothetical protein FIBSPDRAFT_958548 [Fibularhizoctonia sp. CBS 109695]